jgi:alpha-L-rhamnosidase
MQVKPVNITEPAPDTYIFDLGQNITGVPRLTIQGPAGTTIRLRHAEVLNPDGTLYTDNLRAAKQTDHYTLSGQGIEVYQPHFTFHGFRYVELTGLPADISINLDTITGIVLHSDMAQTGTFETDNELVNKLQQNIVWGQRGNFLDVPTDCPQRDERLGWLGDAQIFARTAAHNMDVAGFFAKWMADVEIAQRPSGAFPFLAPDVLARDPGSEHLYGAAGWSDAGVIVPWTVYQVYADKKILSRHYEAMCRWMEFLQITSDELIRKPYGYGDWLDVNDPTNKSLIGTAFFALDAKLMALIAQAAGFKKDIKKWQTLEKNVTLAFNREFVTPSGRIVGESQTGYALALSFDLLPEKVRPQAGVHLTRLIKKRGGHLSTGFLGTSHLMHALTKSGQHEAACRLLLNETYPSWGYSIRNGATTIWERWDGWTKEKGFQNPGMNSFNHYAFGAVGQWMYMNIGGLDVDPQKPGFKHAIIAPRLTPGVYSAKCGYDSVHGRFEVSWTLKGQLMELHAAVPANTGATVRLPARHVDAVREGGRPVMENPDMKNVRAEPFGVTMEIGAGQYRFEARL